MFSMLIVLLFGGLAAAMAMGLFDPLDDSGGNGGGNGGGGDGGGGDSGGGDGDGGTAAITDAAQFFDSFMAGPGVGGTGITPFDQQASDNNDAIWVRDSGVSGGDGDDLLIDGSTVTGGAGNDVFAVSGDTTITDFNAEQDLLLFGAGFAPFWEAYDSDSWSTNATWNDDDFAQYIGEASYDETAVPPEFQVQLAADGSGLEVMAGDAIARLEGVFDIDLAHVALTGSWKYDPGEDVYFADTVSVVSALDDGTAQDITLGDDALAELGLGDDVVTVAGGGSAVFTGDGNDTITGSAGTGDAPGWLTANAGDGDDLITLDDTRGIIVAGAGDDTVSVGDAGEDRLFFHHDNQTSDYSDRTGDYAVLVDGGAGDDTIEAGAGAYVLPGEGSDDVTLTVGDAMLDDEGQVRLDDPLDSLFLAIDDDLPGEIWAELNFVTVRYSGDTTSLHLDMVIRFHLSEEAAPDLDTLTPFASVTVGYQEFYLPDRVDAVRGSDHFVTDPDITANRVIHGLETGVQGLTLAEFNG